MTRVLSNRAAERARKSADPSAGDHDRLGVANPHADIARRVLEPASLPQRFSTALRVEMCLSFQLASARRGVCLVSESVENFYSLSDASAGFSSPL